MSQRKLTVFCDGFDTLYQEFIKQATLMDVHDSKAVMNQTILCGELFCLEDTATRSAILGALLMNIAYRKQESDGTHHELSSHD